MTVPRTCSHGVPFGKDDYCAGCELISHQSGLEYALQKVERHRRAIARIQAAESGSTPSPKSDSACQSEGEA
jgi:hypothetical protein